jgi:hypothetical protein
MILAQFSGKMGGGWLYKFSVLRIFFTYLVSSGGLVYFRNNEPAIT